MVLLVRWPQLMYQHQHPTESVTHLLFAAMQINIMTWLQGYKWHAFFTCFIRLSLLTVILIRRKPQLRLKHTVPSIFLQWYDLIRLSKINCSICITFAYQPKSYILRSLNGGWLLHHTIVKAELPLNFCKFAESTITFKQCLLLGEYKPDQ